MRLLFEIDRKDYDPNGTVGRRPSVRGIIRRGEKLALVHSRVYDYYKFPGGGYEPGEDDAAALIREVREETGLSVKPDSITPFGYCVRRCKGSIEDIFVQENFYYFCDVTGEIGAQTLDAYEDEEGFALAFVTPEEAIEVNRTHHHGAKQAHPRFLSMIERENRVLALLCEQEKA